MSESADNSQAEKEEEEELPANKINNSGEALNPTRRQSPVSVSYTHLFKVKVHVMSPRVKHTWNKCVAQTKCENAEPISSWQLNF